MSECWLFSMLLSQDLQFFRTKNIVVYFSVVQWNTFNPDITYWSFFIYLPFSYCQVFDFKIVRHVPDNDMSEGAHYRHFDSDGKVLLPPEQMGSSSCHHMACRIIVVLCFSGNLWDNLSYVAIQRRYSQSLDWILRVCCLRIVYTYSIITICEPLFPGELGRSLS